MQPLIARRSVRIRSKDLIYAVLLALGAHLLGLSPEASIGVGLLIAVGPATLGLARAVVSQGDVLRIDESGLTDHRLSSGSIPWEQVKDARQSGQDLFVAIRDPALLGLKRTLWQRLNRPLGQDPETFSLKVGIGGLDVPPDKIVEAVNGHLASRR